MNMLATAIAFASTKHQDQLDKGGNPYILHPLRMMMRLRTDDQELMAIAVLHDVVEDCKVTYDQLRDIGMSERVIDGIKCLTKISGESYDQFVDRVLLNRDAMLVKREDLRDNSDITRLKGLTEKDKERINKYMIAYHRINTRLKVWDKIQHSVVNNEWEV